MATVKGAWRFNETPTMSSDLSQGVNFTTSNNYKFARIIYTFGHMEYVTSRNTYHWAYSPYVWEDPWFRFINFGETEQTVSDTFYNWLTANAIPLSDEYITFVNNTSDTLYVVMYEYRELEEYNGVLFYDLVPNVAITIHKNANFPVNVFRAHKGSYGSDITLIPSINGVYVEGKEDFATAHAEPMSIPSGTTILFDENSAEAELNRRWGIVVSAVETSKTLITYNGATVEMAEGQKATLICAGKKMKTDVVITPAFAVDFTYGDIKNTAEMGDTATLKCAGKKMATDVVIISTPISSNFVLADGSVLITSDGKIFEVK